MIEEIKYIADNFQLEEISFADDSFSLSREHVLHLYSLSKKLLRNYNWRWRCATRVDLVDNDLLNKMYDMGCYSITFGVEAGSQNILNSIGKNITLDQVKKAVDTALNIGIKVVCAFMFPHPEDTEETILEQKHFMKKLAEIGATETLAFTTPFPGTYYYDHAGELGINVLASSWDEYDAKHLIITTKNLNEKRLRELLAELIQEVGLKTELEENVNYMFTDTTEYGYK